MDELERLRQAVRNYLDDAHRADMTGARQPWPSELEDLVGWQEPPDAG